MTEERRIECECGPHCLGTDDDACPHSKVITKPGEYVPTPPRTPPSSRRLGAEIPLRLVITPPIEIEEGIYPHRYVPPNSPYTAPPRTHNYEDYLNAMRSGRPLPESSTSPSKQEYGSYRATMQNHFPHPKLNFDSLVSTLEDVVRKGEEPGKQGEGLSTWGEPRMDAQKRLWHLSSLDMGTQKVKDPWGFSSTGVSTAASRSVTPARLGRRGTA